MQRTCKQKTAEVQRASPHAAFSKRRSRDSNDVDPLPTLTTLETNRRIVVSAIAGDDCYFVSTGNETAGEIGEVLCCRNHIRVETLIEEQDSQLNVDSCLKILNCFFQTLSQWNCRVPAKQQLRFSDIGFALSRIVGGQWLMSKS